MKRWMAMGIVAVFTLMVFSGLAQASEERHVVNYIGGGDVLFGAPGPKCDPLVPDYEYGGSCRRSCPGGDATVTVDDETYGTDMRFQVKVDDWPFYSNQFYNSGDTIDCNYLSIRLPGSLQRTTYGTITIE